MKTKTTVRFIKNITFGNKSWPNTPEGIKKYIEYLQLLDDLYYEMIETDTGTTYHECTIFED